MAALTKDIEAFKVGVPGNASQPVNLPLKNSTVAGSTVYRGSVAITRSGYMVAATTPQSTDIVWGIVAQAGPGTIDSGPGITGGTGDGSVTVEVETGTFWLQSGTGSDAIAAANIGATCYLMNETTVGLTTSGNSRPTAGIVFAIAGSNYPVVAPVQTGMVAVHLGSNQSTGAPQ